MKKERQKLIVKIISEEDIGIQEVIQERLEQQGLKVTQATISRDIKELCLVKTLGANGLYKYDLPVSSKEKNKTPQELFVNIFHQSGASVDIAMNTVVIKTHVGMAQAVCSKLDGTGYDALVGTIAGDDTIFALFRTENDAKAFYNSLNDISRQVK